MEEKTQMLKEDRKREEEKRFKREEEEKKRDAINQGKKVVTLMRCFDCHKHKWNTNHVEAKYRNFEQMLREAVEACGEGEVYLSVNTMDMKKYWKIGCFDIYYPNDQLIFSKLEQKIWPSIQNVTNHIMRRHEEVKEKERQQKAAENK